MPQSGKSLIKKYPIESGKFSATSGNQDSGTNQAPTGIEHGWSDDVFLPEKSIR
jgi:hypothetical protein